MIGNEDSDMGDTRSNIVLVHTDTNPQKIGAPEIQSFILNNGKFTSVIRLSAFEFSVRYKSKDSIEKSIHISFSKDNWTPQDSELPTSLRSGHHQKAKAFQSKSEAL